MEQVYLEDPSVLQDHHHHQHAHNHHQQHHHHHHELVDPTLGGVHLDPETGAHNAYTIEHEHDPLGVVDDQDHTGGVPDLGLHAVEHSGGHEQGLQDHLQQHHQQQQQEQDHQQHLQHDQDAYDQQHHHQMQEQHHVHQSLHNHQQHNQHLEMDPNQTGHSHSHTTSSYHDHLAGLHEIGVELGHAESSNLNIHGDGGMTMGMGIEGQGEVEGEGEKPRVSHNRNPGGKNQYGNPVDTDKLRDILRQYFNVECITEWKTIMSRLDAEHGIRIKRATLGRYLRQFNIGGSRRHNYSKDSAMPLVVNHIRENDPECKDSPSKVMKDLGRKGIHVKRDLIRLIMQEHFPLGFDQRRRNSKFKKKRLDGEPGEMEMEDEGQGGLLDPNAHQQHPHEQVGVGGTLNQHHQHQLGMLQQQQQQQQQQQHQVGMDLNMPSDPVESARKLEEAQAEAARAIIMNMALQAQMASQGYRTQQHGHGHATRQMQAQHHQLPQHHLDVGEGSSTGARHNHQQPQHLSNATSGILQDLAAGVSGSATDESNVEIDALREEAMRQVAQMEGYRTGEYDENDNEVGEGAYMEGEVEAEDGAEAEEAGVEGEVDGQTEQAGGMEDGLDMGMDMGMAMGDETGVEAYPEGDTQGYDEGVYGEEQGEVPLEEGQEQDQEHGELGELEDNETVQGLEQQEVLAEDDLRLNEVEGLDPSLAEHGHSHGHS